MPKHDCLRLKFPRGWQRKFVEEVFEKSGLPTKSLAKTVYVSPRTIRDWKREKFNISENAVNIFCKKFNIPQPKNKVELIKNWKRVKFEISKKGGFAHSVKEFRYPKPNKDLAEFVGIMLGDGGINSSQISITLNRNADKDYIVYVKKLCSSLFGEEPNFFQKKDCNADVIYYSGIKLIEYLVKIGLKIGNKVKQQVKVPEWVEESNVYKIACLKGLMDTDGCIAKCTHKYKAKKYVYYNPCFANRSKPLLKFVTNTLTRLGLHPSVAGERIWLYNKAEVCAYFDLVGSNNTRLLKFQEESHSWSIAEVR